MEKYDGHMTATHILDYFGTFGSFGLLMNFMTFLDFIFSIQSRPRVLIKSLVAGLHAGTCVLLIVLEIVLRLAAMFILLLCKLPTCSTCRYVLK
jgi:hypothetical protein